MEAQPAAYIREAFKVAGIRVDDLRVTNYDPLMFGNLVAFVDTNVGRLTVTYDRGFYIEADQPDRLEPVRARLLDALDAAKLASVA